MCASFYYKLADTMKKLEKISNDCDYDCGKEKPFFFYILKFC